MISNMPHIGTDVLRDVVLKLQEKLGWYYKDDSEFIYKNWNKSSFPT